MIAFIVNHCGELQPDQTTTRLIQACHGRGLGVAVFDVFSLAVRSVDDVRAWAVVLPQTPPLSRAQICSAARSGKRTEIRTQQLELVVIRTSPGRDLENAWAHRMMLHAALQLRDSGVDVVNDPVGLERASSKLYAACLPAELTPRTVVAHSWEAIARFMDELGGPVVVKPLLGSNGRDVFFVEYRDAANVRQICAMLGRTGYLVVQEFLEEAVDGDKRVLLLDGEVLELDGMVAAVHRVPRLGELRSNVSLGARAQATELSARERAICAQAAELLLDDGIRFSGVDLLGDKLLEVNVYSTGGLVDAEKFYGRDYGSAVIDALISRA